MKRSIFLLSLVLLLTLVVAGSASAATWTEIQEVDVGISYPSWVQIQRVDVVVHPAQWNLIQTVDVEISQAEWVLIQTVDVSVTIPAGVLLWTGGGADNLASNPDNWNQGVAPFNGADVIFDSTSVKDCTWDLDASTVMVRSMTLATGYTGTLGLYSDLNVGDGGIVQASGRLTGNNKAIYNAGDLNKTGGIITGVHWYAIGDSNWKINSQMVTNSLTVQANITLTGAEYYMYSLVVANGKQLTLDGVSLRIDNPSLSRLINNGCIVGSGRLWLVFYYQNPVLNIGKNYCNISLYGPGDGQCNVLVTLAGPMDVRKLSIYSNHASNKITLDLAGHSLTASSITVGTRGAIVGDGTIYNAGDLDTSSGLFDFTGKYNQTGNGKITLATGHKINDLTVYAPVRLTLGSDITVQGEIVGIKNIVLNGYRLILTGVTNIGEYSSEFNVSEPVFIPIISPIQDGLQVYGDIPRWLRYDPIKGGLYGIPTKLGMNEFNITVYSPYVSLFTQRISFAVVDVPTIEHASKGQSIGNIISIVLTMVIVGICGITRSSSGYFDYDVSNALLGAAVGISVLVFASVIPSYGLVLVALIFVAMYWGGR